MKAFTWMFTWDRPSTKRRMSLRPLTRRSNGNAKPPVWVGFTCSPKERGLEAVSKVGKHRETQTHFSFEIYRLNSRQTNESLRNSTKEPKEGPLKGKLDQIRHSNANQAPPKNPNNYPKNFKRHPKTIQKPKKWSS